MRVISKDEKIKRGCIYCIHIKKFRNHDGVRSGCQFDECPYTVLDKYESYEEFMASEDSRIPVDEFFQTAADCYTLATPYKTQKRRSFDGG